MSGRRRSPQPFRSLAELESAGRRNASPAVREFVESGAEAERTRAANEAAFDRWWLLPRVLRDVRSVDLSTRLLGTKVAAPFFAAPTAYQGAVGPGGERSTARALGRAGILGVYSTLSSRSLEEIGRASGGGPHWFQLYLQPTVERSIELVRRAERAGFSAVVVTVDAPLLGSRDRQGRLGFALDRPAPLGNGPQVEPPGRNLTERAGRYDLEGGAEYSWGVLRRLAKETRLPLVVKGVLSPSEARRAVRCGARAVIVSNHGGRQLDRAIPAVEALPGVVRAVGSRAEVYLDGGVRRASEILVALALGARAVGCGRPVLWALAAGGERGVARWAELLASELATGLLLLGAGRVSEVDATRVRSSDGKVVAAVRDAWE